MSSAPPRPRRRSIHRGPARLLLAATVVLLAACSGPDDVVVDDGQDAPSASERDLAASDLWMDFERSQRSASGETEFPDAVGGDVVGVVVSASGGDVEVVDGADGSGSAIAFPPLCTDETGCPRAMVEIASDPALEPHERSFEFGATVWLDLDQTTTGSNIVQKGRFDTDGGLWKLQVDSEEGQPSCVVRSGADLLRVRSEVSIADSAWHRVTCTRDAEGIGIDVDGEQERTAGVLGSVDSEWPIRIGSPGVGEGDDQFHGRVDDVFLRIVPED